MLSVKIDELQNIALLEPNGALSKEDFVAAAQIIDPYLEKAGCLNGLVIYARAFPGWESFSALVQHLKFVRTHEKQVARVAISTDSILAHPAESVAKHFIHAEIKAFSYAEFDQAKVWASQRP